MPSLREFVEKEIEGASGVTVPLDSRNIICFDNEAFRYLVLTKNLSEEERQSFAELQEHTTFCRSWNISQEASEKLVKYAQQLPVLNMAEVVSYNQSRTLSADLVEQIIEALVKLCKQAEVSGKYTEPSQRAIIEKAAQVTAYLSSKAVTIFNDHLDAHLEEKIKAFKSSVLEDQSSLARRFEMLRTMYQNGVRSFRSNSQIIDIDAKIKELYALLQEASSRASKFSF